jgi:cytochrome P450
MEPWIEAEAHRLVDRVMDRGRMELVADFALPLPVLVIARMLGIEVTDPAALKSWSDKEVLRFRSPFQIIYRYVARDTEINGCALREGRLHLHPSSRPRREPWCRGASPSSSGRR